ncbi:MAG: DUF4838 domain-containing protein [Spirochaetaceae bacterium]|jgi:hypothetical protein|nr:DUF4838 domain-containing protein [Spirochaetaceae bacterium]
MVVLDVSKKWVILLPLQITTARVMGEELARCIGLLRNAGGSGSDAPRILDALGPSPEDAIPLVALYVESEGDIKNGFFWRARRDRIEIYGDSGRGLCNGVYDFLKTLGFRWPKPGEEEVPRGDPDKPWLFPLGEGNGKSPSQPFPARRRLVLPGNRQNGDTPISRDALIPWAARNQIDALVIPPEQGDSAVFKKFKRERTAEESFRSLAQVYALSLEAGGWMLSRLVPRRYFFLHRDMFRMERGKRVKNFNFCPTSPEAIRFIQREAEKFFRSWPEVQVFHLWPDRGHEKTWCACPACRAFTPEEQNRIAVNSAADVLMKINPQARLSYYEDFEEPGAIVVRSNMFPLTGGLEMPPIS